MVSKARIDEMDFSQNGGFEQQKMQTVAHRHALEDDDFGEGEVEDTQAINFDGSLTAAAGLLKPPISSKPSGLALKQQQSR